jgi:hypothetical protein
MYQVIAQKIQGGRIGFGSEWIVSIADLYVRNLEIKGSLIIETPHIVGHRENGRCEISDETGKCTLENVKVYNEGSCHRLTPWDLSLHGESCRISIGRNAEFIAKDLVFRGNIRIEVEDFTRLIAYEKDGIIVYHKEPLLEIKPFYTYEFQENFELIATRNI